MKNSTPTPWKTDLEICPVTGSISIYANGPILYVHDNTNGPENQKANAELIVQAVNSHQALVDALSYYASPQARKHGYDNGALANAALATLIPGALTTK